MKMPNASKTRRRFMAASLGGGLLSLLPLRQAWALPDDMATAIRQFTGGAEVTVGKVTLEVAKLVDNGNSVPLRVTVDSPMTPEQYVTAIAVFNERNPQSDVAKFQLGPRAAKAVVATRIRLATSQKLVAIARLSNGSYWSASTDVIVTLAACLEGEA